MEKSFSRSNTWFQMSRRSSSSFLRQHDLGAMVHLGAKYIGILALRLGEKCTMETERSDFSNRGLISTIEQKSWSLRFKVFELTNWFSPFSFDERLARVTLAFNQVIPGIMQTYLTWNLFGHKYTFKSKIKPALMAQAHYRYLPISKILASNFSRDLPLDYEDIWSWLIASLIY